MHSVVRKSSLYTIRRNGFMKTAPGAYVENYFSKVITKRMQSDAAYYVNYSKRTARITEEDYSITVDVTGPQRVTY